MAHYADAVVVFGQANQDSELLAGGIQTDLKSVDFTEPAVDGATRLVSL